MSIGSLTILFVNKRYIRPAAAKGDCCGRADVAKHSVRTTYPVRRARHAPAAASVMPAMIQQSRTMTELVMPAPSKNAEERMAVPAAPSGRYWPMAPHGLGSQCMPVAMPESGLEMNSMVTAPRPKPAIPSSEFRPRTVVEIAAIPRMITPVVGQKLASRASKPK